MPNEVTFAAQLWLSLQPIFLTYICIQVLGRMQETTNQSGYRRFASSVCVTSEFVTQHGKKTSFFHWEFELKTRQKINFLKYHLCEFPLPVILTRQVILQMVRFALHISMGMLHQRHRTQLRSNKTWNAKASICTVWKLVRVQLLEMLHFSRSLRGVKSRECMPRLARHQLEKKTSCGKEIKLFSVLAESPSSRGSKALGSATLRRSVYTPQHGFVNLAAQLVETSRKAAADHRHRFMYWRCWRLGARGTPSLVRLASTAQQTNHY